MSPATTIPCANCGDLFVRGFGNSRFCCDYCRFAAKVLIVDDCWIWQGQVERSGYGRFFFRGGWRRAHRASFVLHGMPLPSELTVDHLCHTPLCVNPDHLEAVTQAVNNRRARPRGPRAVRANQCHRGHEFTPENTYHYRGRQVCRTCQRMTVANYAARKRSVA